MENEDKANVDINKELIKKKIKEKITKELLDEIYEELKQEYEIEALEKEQEPTKPIPEEDLELVEIPKEKFSVSLNLKTLLKFASHALKYANPDIPKSEWVEVIGLLAGEMDSEDVLHVRDAYPMGHGTAVHAQIKDYNNFARAFNDLKKRGFFICGWYHSHPSYGTFMSNEDMDTQARYQKLWKDSIAIVVDPYQIDGSSYGFEVFRANLKKNKWFSVPFEIKESVDEKTIYKLLKFISPIIDGNAIYLEYDE
jgi:proteasome lid subunit RPN8/RPN11